MRNTKDPYLPVPYWWWRECAIPLSRSDNLRPSLQRVNKIINSLQTRFGDYIYMTIVILLQSYKYNKVKMCLFPGPRRICPRLQTLRGNLLRVDPSSSCPDLPNQEPKVAGAVLRHRQRVPGDLFRHHHVLYLQWTS